MKKLSFTPLLLFILVSIWMFAPAAPVEAAACYPLPAGSAGPCEDAGRPAPSQAPWLRAHPVWDSVDGWNWPEKATLRLTIDDPATPAAPDLAMDMPGQADPALGSVWFEFGGVYDLKAGDRVTLSDGATTRELVVADLTIDTIDVAAGTVSGMAPAGASVRLPNPPPPDRALFVTAGGDGKWQADFRKAGFTLAPGKMVIAEVHEADGDLTSFEWEIPALARTIHRPVAEFLYPNVTGAFIELQAEPLRPGLWTRVQWQDAAGGWHEIEGWQGAFNPDQRVLWYVGEEHLGRGPFRWLVYAEEGGELLGVSASFDLPARGELLHVRVTLADHSEDGGLTSSRVENGQSAGNIALGKPVVVVTNGADDDRENPGIRASDITDGRLDYLPAGDAHEDGVVGYVNDDYNQRMVITVTIDLQGTYDVTRIRYNMGDVQRTDAWNADRMTTVFGATPTTPGTPGQGVWTEQTGRATLSSVTIVLEKTRVLFENDWLFIGEIEVYGVPSGS